MRSIAISCWQRLLKTSGLFILSYLRAGGDATASGLRQAILELSATVGSQVSVEFPDGKKAFGLAKDIDETGRLVVSTQNETLSVSAGDVLHLRKA
jgi:biotin-(acetyl-CoA carboxylase) ligase